MKRPELEALQRPLLRELAVLGRPAAGPELCQRLGVSQPTFSRLVAQLGSRLLVVGRARATRYLGRRSIEGVGEAAPIYELDPEGRARRLATLHAVLPQGFYVESLAEDAESGHFTDLPYFLNELRPSGFLGRLIPARHPELDAPRDVRLWSADQVLRYLVLCGWDLPGDLIVGDRAFERYVAAAPAPPQRVKARARQRVYPELARDILRTSAAGSSAAGEQPKFLAFREPGPTPVLVKFSPPRADAPSRRQADLLIAEHLALQTLNAHGHAAAHSELVLAGDQVFLEVVRFDRTPAGGRRGVLSLLALDAEFVGRAQSWSDSAARLVELGIVTASVAGDMLWLELFGHLIANTDMHQGNLSFFTRGSRILGLAPVYDMLPAGYAGEAGLLPGEKLRLPALAPQHASVWDTASRAALDLWQRVAHHPRISPGFQRIARANFRRVETWRQGGHLLPGSPIAPT